MVWRNPSQSTVWWWQGDGLEESITVDCFGGGRVMFRAGIHHSRRKVSVHVAGALTGIRYRDEILQHDIIPHTNVSA